VAATDSTVLLLGQSGTARSYSLAAIHHLSPRNAQPFVALNCAAIPEGLVENELFGHERGAFTGAGSRKVGKMELAKPRQRFFLDEIAETSIGHASQAAAACSKSEVRARRRNATGGDRCAHSGSHQQDLRDAVASKSFREDLFFRVAAVPSRFLPCANAATMF